MIHNRKDVRSNWQIFLTLVLILYMIGWNYHGVAAAGTTYYVDKTNALCTDAGTGTLVAPFCTIGKGASIATAGDTVRVLAGTYAETVNGANSGSAGLPITYSAAPGVTVTGNGTATGSAFRMSGKGYIVVDGFTITGTVDYGIYTFGSNNITLSNNHVSNSGSPVSGSTRSGIYINSTTNSTISGNTTDHNSSHGILLTNGSSNNTVINNVSFANAEQWQRNANGIRLDASTNNTLLHNITYGNEDSGIANLTGSIGNFIIGNLTYGNGDHGIEFNAAPNNTVVGNTVQGNVTAGINFEGASAPGSGGATVINNIMVDNGLRLQIGGGTASGQPGNLRFDANSLIGNTLDYNIFYLNSGTVEIEWGATNYATLAAFQGAVAGQEIHGVQADPIFVAPALIAQRPAAAPFNLTANLGNYHLKAGSQAIDSANSNASNEPILDLEGNARVDDPFTPNSGAGTRTYDDRGAYEFQPVAGAALPTVTTQTVTSIGNTTATGNGNITDLGVPNPTQHGVVWSTSINPTISDNKTTDGPVNTTGAFTSNITGLTPGTVYHVRAYAWNSAGISYGNDISFTSANNIYYVDKTNGSCSDVLAGAGLTPAFPFCTIGKGASIAVAGNIVRVLAGTYAETVNGANSGSAGLPITYSAVSGVTVTGNGIATGSAFRMSGKSYIVVDGFTITGTMDYGIYVFGSNHITISNNHISSSGSPMSSSTRSGIYINSTTNSTISGNTSDHNSSHGIQLTNGSNNNLVSNNVSFGNAQEWQRDASGVRLDASTNNTLLHNISYGNEDSGITNSTGSSGNLIIGNLLYGNGDHGIDNLNSPNNTVIGNTVQGNVTAGINFEGASAPGSGGATVINNIMVDNGLRQLVGGGTSAGQPSNLRFDATSLIGNTLDYNIFFLNSAASLIQWNGTNYATLLAFRVAQPTQETNGLQANPLFIAPAPVAQRPAVAPFNVTVNVGNYHLTAGSPAIDSANSNASNEPTLDLDGNARVDDPATANSGAGTRIYDDRGVYEFQPTIGVTLPTVTTQAVTSIGNTTATGNGTLTNLGIPNPTAYGVVWSTTLNPTTADNISDLGATGATGAFTASITGLTPGTLYHVRAFATNTVGTSYGADVTFTPLLTPTVTTQTVTAIGGTSATGNGTITNLGVPNPTAYGVAWSTTLNPTTADNVSNLGAAGATGVFTAPITGLTSGTLYHVRAFATNIAGTSYGADFTFTTLLTPTVTTQAVTAIGTTTATGNGTLTDLGVPNPTAYGVVWSTTLNPTTANNVSNLGAVSVTGTFTAPITGLTPGTQYHVRAFATNAVGTSYGADVIFTTSLTAPIMTTNAATTVSGNGATLNGTVNANNSSTTVTFEYGLTAAYGTTVTATPSPVTGSTNTAVTYVLSGLLPNTTYHFRVVGVSAGGTTNGADLTFITSTTAPTVTTNAANTITATSATLNGTVNANNSSTTITFDYGLTAAYGTTVTAAESPVTGSTNTAVTYALSGLLPNTTYHFRVVGVSTGGTANGGDLTFTTNAIAPTVTTDPASGISATSATLNGTVNANNSSTTVTFEYGLTAAYGTTVTATPSPVTGLANTAVIYALNGLLPNTAYHFRVVGVSTGGTTNGADVTFTTNAIAPTITSGAPLAGTVGVAAYSHIFTATGVPTPTFTLTGTLPAGLTFNGVDTISGTPISGGTFAGITVTATNGIAPDATQIISITINAPTISLSPATLPATTVGSAYSQTITASGGTPSYTFGVTAGALPAGLTLSSGGALTGTPTAGGTFNFTVTATDSSTGTGPYTGSQAYSVTINNNTLVTIDQAIGQADPTNGSPINLTVVFNEAVTGFATGDVSFTGSTVGGTLTGSITEIAPNDGTTYNVAVTGMSSAGTVVATIPAGVATGSITTNVASTSTDNTVTYDPTNPTVASTDLVASYTGTGPGSFIATFSKAVNDPAGNTGTEDVTNPVNYLLVNKGTNGVVDTGSCAGGVVADDTQVTVTSVFYKSTTFQATVKLIGALPVGSYRLFICGTTSIVDLVGNHLNSGTDYTFDFVVQTTTQSGGSSNSQQTSLLPTTGFPQNKVTTLPFQSANKAYASTDLWLEIPKLGVKMSIVGVPQTKDGWDISWLGKNAGWLNGSAFPTWNGNSVITGHVWDALNKPGPFVGLINLTYGDQIKVHTFGQVYVYEVIESQVVQPSNITAAFKHEKKSWLTLITCENYQDKTETYTNRRMVRAILVSVVSEK